MAHIWYINKKLIFLSIPGLQGLIMSSKNNEDDEGVRQQRQLNRLESLRRKMGILKSPDASAEETRQKKKQHELGH